VRDRRGLVVGAVLSAALAVSGCSETAKPSPGGEAAKPTAGSAATAVTKGGPPIPPNATDADYDQLRQTYSARPDFIVICERDRPLKVVGNAMEAGEWDEVLTLSEPWTTRCAVDVDAHVARTVAFEKLGRTAESAAEREMAIGLVKSVMRSGDGKSPQTAFVVISVGEEFSTLGALGLRPTKQRVEANDIHVITVEKDGQTGDIYFNAAIDNQRQKQAGQLGVQKSPPPPQ
jgi:hypothetical protein